MPFVKPGARSARRLPIGTEPLAGGAASFRVWAPKRRSVEVEILDADGAVERRENLESEGSGGHFFGEIGAVPAGTLYRFRLDGGDSRPDPASRFQPEGPHGPSMVVDPFAFAWTDGDWPGVELRGQVFYELHVGTFTPEGTWDAAIERLADLVDVGVTVIELMPIADYSGKFGWSYDGVNLFAPTRNLGTPDDVRRFVDRAHRHGLGVILDVVYNHFGPDGNYLFEYSDDFLSRDHENEWGSCLNYDGEGSTGVREFVLSNVRYWIEEFHFDGYRVDATQDVKDRSHPHILADLARVARESAGTKKILIIGENEPQCSMMVRPASEGGYGFDALWNDDHHHSAMIAATGRREAYYGDYRGTPQELISAIKRGFLYQGQRNPRQKAPRGMPGLDLRPEAFVTFLQNHDQVANSARGARLHRLTTPGRYRALTALTLLGPGTPLLFQGQEFAASADFLYFGDQPEPIAEAIDKGRKDFLTQFPSLSDPETQRRIARPNALETFQRSKLDPSERVKHAWATDLHRDLLRLRREDPVFSAPRLGGVDGAVLGAEAFVLRFFGTDGNDRLMLVNLGVDLDYAPVVEPLLAPPANRGWRLLWSSEDPKYLGDGTPTIEGDDGWRLPGHSAIVLAAAVRQGNETRR